MHVDMFMYTTFGHRIWKIRILYWRLLIVSYKFADDLTTKPRRDYRDYKKAIVGMLSYPLGCEAYESDETQRVTFTPP